MKLFFTVILGSTLLLSGCNTTTGGDMLQDDSASGTGTPQAVICLEGDHSVASGDMCLQDDAACYPIADGSWCTGPRASNCPMGSDPLPSELPCPDNARCFPQSESLQCVIGG